MWRIHFEVWTSEKEEIALRSEELYDSAEEAAMWIQNHIEYPDDFIFLDEDGIEYQLDAEDEFEEAAVEEE